MQTKLEPTRENLSGLASSPIPQIPERPVSPALARKCTSCGLVDTPHRLEGHYDERGEVLVHHTVTVELRYLKKQSDFTPRHQSRGWKLLTWQGRPAIERFICFPCLEGHRLMEREFRSKISAELKSSAKQDNYYSSLCEE